MPRRFSIARLVTFGFIITVFLVIGFQFLAGSKTGHYYQITVNNEVYSATEIKVDSTANRITFQNVFGATVQAPLDRTVILQYY